MLGLRRALMCGLVRAALAHCPPDSPVTRLTRVPTPPAPPPFFFGRMKLFFFYCDSTTMSGGHMSKKKAPLTTVNFLLPVTDGSLRPNGKRASFFPVIFQSFESLSVVTDRQTDRQTDALKGCGLSNLPVERINDYTKSVLLFHAPLPKM